MKLLCPWCLGELPGKPGQVAKCRHCASDIHWGGKTPFKTAEEAKAALQQRALDELKAAIEKRDIQTEPAASVVPPKSVDAPADVSVPRASNRIRSASIIEWWNDWRVRWREYREDRAYRKKLLLEHGDPNDLAVWWLRWRRYVLLLPLCVLLLTFVLHDNFAEYGVISFRHPSTWGTITPSVAEVFVKKHEFNDALFLDNLTTITPKVAEALAKHRGRLFLNGLTTITPEVAEALAKHEGALWLDGLTTITPEVAEALAKCERLLFLNGLTALTSVALAEKWVNGRVRLQTNDLTTITPEVAEALAKHKAKDEGDFLFLNGLTTITPEVAEALAKHEGELDLNGLTTITPEALKILRANPNIRLPSAFYEKP